MTKQKRKYVSPRLETLEVLVERGFAETILRKNANLYVDKNENASTDEVNLDNDWEQNSNQWFY